MSVEDRSKPAMPRFPVSYWLASTQRPSFGKLEQDLTVDAAVVGAGITGITTAYLLAREGKRVALVEACRILNGTTGHTTAKITAQHDLIYDDFMREFGQDLAFLYYAANRDGMDFIRKMVRGLDIDCQFAEEDAYLTGGGAADKLGVTEGGAYDGCGKTGAEKAESMADGKPG